MNVMPGYWMPLLGNFAYQDCRHLRHKDKGVSFRVYEARSLKFYTFYSN